VRAFWTGFTVFGIGHMLLAFGPAFDELLVTRLLTEGVAEAASFSVFERTYETLTSFRISALSLLSLLVAIAGGYVVRYLCMASEQHKQEQHGR
jgi:ABC-type spermidine/putrescine transport system permease subunit II